MRKPERSEGQFRYKALPDGRASDTAANLFDCATMNGARSIGAPNGTLEVGKPADFFTVDLSDPSIAGASQDDLLSVLFFRRRARPFAKWSSAESRLFPKDSI